jgi:hypothetical protein
MNRLVFLILILIPIHLTAQNCRLLNELNLSGKKMQTDGLDNIYITDYQRLSKYDLKGNKLAEYSNKQLGNITSADVSDAFRILLFFKDFNQLVNLDNFLSELGSNIILDQLGVQRTEAICSASNGGFWLFNSQENRLLYYDKSLAPVYKSIDLSSITDSIGIPTGLQEINTLVYLNIPENGLFVFDRFGNYLKTLPYKNLETFQVNGNKLLGLSTNVIKIYDLNTFSEEILTIPGNDIMSVQFLQNNKYIVLKKDKIEIYESLKL